MSGDGAVVVGLGDLAVGPRAFRWTQGSGMVSLGVLSGGSTSAATSANHDGSVVVGYSDTPSAFSEAFRWTQGSGMVGLGFLTGGSFSAAYGSNTDGSVVVGYGDSTGHFVEAMRWTQGSGMVGPGYPAGRNVQCRATHQQ